MSVKTRTSADETRARILDVAEEHFRRIGYAKTAVADIAAALDMSPANVYRFFASKSAINDAICRRCLDECGALAQSVARGSGSAAERLERLAIELHRFNKARCTDEKRLHDMVEVAMAESWQAIQAHLAEIVAIFTTLIAEGMAAGEFRQGDAAEAGLTVKQALTSVLHPVLIAQSAGEDLEAETRRLVRFLIQALR